MAQVEIKGLEKAFDGNLTVKGIDLTVRDGEFLTILGPSGCGKSTLLRMIAGLEHPTAGSVHIGGVDATRLHPKDRNIAMVFQNYALYPHLSIGRNIAFPLEVQGASRATIDQKVKEAARIVRIDHLLNRKPRQVSGGERQRTALARSLVRDPTVFLLDEPLSNLDAKLRHTAREELRHLQQRIGLTALYVTHDQVEAMGLGDRIVVMQSGVIRQIGTPHEVYKYPADTFVATFMGTPPMNLVEIGDRLVGLRPENMHLPSRNGDGRAVFRLPVKVERVEYLGSSQLIYAVTTGSMPETRIIAQAPAETDISLPPDAQVEFETPWSEVRYFSKESGKAIAVEPPAARQLGGVNV